MREYLVRPDEFLITSFTCITLIHLQGNDQSIHIHYIRKDEFNQNTLIGHIHDI